MQQRRLFSSEQPIDEIAAAFAARLSSAPRLVAPPPWVWLTHDGSVRVCCEPTPWPAPPAWRLTAWEVPPGPTSRYCLHREGLGRLNLRLPAAPLEAAAMRVRTLRRAAEAPGLTPDDRQRRRVLADQTDHAVMLMWREDALQNRAAALAAIHEAVPLAEQVGHADRGTVLVDLADFTPHVSSDDHWQLLQAVLARPRTPSVASQGSLQAGGPNRLALVEVTRG